MITITNKSKKSLVFNLPHRDYCTKIQKCGCTVKEVRITDYSKEGEKQVKAVRQKIPQSIHIPAGQSIPWKEDKIVFVPEIAKARKKGKISIQ